MALPDELLDELLSAHLDGATSDDERARVEAMLRDDASVRERMQLLEEDRDAMRALMRRSVSAPESLLANTMQAIAEQSSTGAVVSPLSEPSKLGELESVGSRRGPILWIAAIAASLLFVVWISRQGTDDPVEQVTIAKLDQKTNTDLAEPKNNTVEPSAEPPRNELASEPLLADANGPTPLENSVELSSAGDETNSAMDTDASDSVASNDATAEKSETRGVAELPNVIPGGQSFRFLMVVSVERTELGQQSDAFIRALAEANIEMGEERPVSEALVGAAISGSSKPRTLDDEMPEVLLLESPVKKLDLLIKQLARDRENIGSVGLTMITSNDEALINVFDAVRASDPTRVRHQGRMVPLKGDSDAFDVWTSALAGRQFQPISSADVLQMSGAGMSGSETGENPMSNLLLLVK